MLRRVDSNAASSSFLLTCRTSQAIPLFDKSIVVVMGSRCFFLTPWYHRHSKAPICSSCFSRRCPPPPPYFPSSQAPFFLVIRGSFCTRIFPAPLLYCSALLSSRIRRFRIAPEIRPSRSAIFPFTPSLSFEGQRDFPESMLLPPPVGQTEHPS